MFEIKMAKGGRVVSLINNKVIFAMFYMMYTGTKNVNVALRVALMLRHFNENSCSGPSVCSIILISRFLGSGYLPNIPWHLRIYFYIVG